MKIGSLFSGIGGMEIGFEREGFETEWFVEKDLFCQSILRKHWPSKPIFGSIEDIDFKKLPTVDILAGGFPCQDISIAGKGRGIIHGERSSLWKHFNRAIGEIRPKYAVIENVSAITFRGLCNVLSDLAEEGYDAEWFDLRASDFGALHKRERIFIIAYPNKLGRNDRSDYWKERLFLQTEKREIEENESEWNRREFGFNENPPLIVTDDWCNRIQRFAKETLSWKQGGFGNFQNVKRIEDFKGRSDIPEPLLRRSNNGIPNRVDRTKSIGNSVVPIVAQFIARRIKEIEKG